MNPDDRDGRPTVGGYSDGYGAGFSDGYGAGLRTALSLVRAAQRRPILGQSSEAELLALADALASAEASHRDRAVHLVREDPR